MNKKPKKNILRRVLLTFVVSAFLLAFIPMVYFLTLISVDYKSFPFITTKIEKIINQSFSESVYISIEKSAIKFSDLHKIKIKFDDIKLLSDNSQELLLPKIEVEFSIFKLALFKIVPSKIKIINPEIEVDNTDNKPQIALSGVSDQEMLLQQNFLKFLSKIFLSLKEKQIAINNFSIVDGKINFKNNTQQQTINLKELQISTSFESGSLRLISQNIISFDPSLPDLELGTNCQFRKADGLQCDVSFKNFLPASIVFFDPKLLPLKNITGSLDGNINFVVDTNYQISLASFDISSKSGSISYPQFFSNQLQFQNFAASGKFDNVLKTISLNNLNCNFGDAQFAMSLSISDFLDQNRQQTAMQFKINNFQTDDLEKFWPLFLNEKDIRSWVIEHIKNGVIKDGYASMVLAKKNGENYLQKIESQIAFSGLNLQYDAAFPPISNIDGIASFDKKQMKIDISKGEVLDSKISFASVSIPDFSAKKTMLEIGGKVFGAAEDGLKHIGYKSEFAKVIDQYFSGKADTTLLIKLPINDNLQLQDAYINVSSNIKGFNNDYIDGDSNLLVSTVKEFGGNNFVIEADLTDANVHLKQLNINKKKGVESKIKTTLSFDKASNLYLEEFDWRQNNSSLNGNLSLQTQPFKVKEVSLKNRNFIINSNFDLHYKVTNNSRSIKLKGKSLDLRTILSTPSDKDNFQGFKYYQKNNIEIDVGKIDLLNQQTFKDIKVDVSCDRYRCRNGFIKGKLNDTKNIDIKIFKSAKKNFSQAVGSIDDISVLVKAFDLSNKIIGGNAKIDTEIGDGQLQGEVKIDSGFTVLKNEVVEKIYSNSVMKFKDKILNSNEINFDKLKLEFEFKNNVLKINTLIANSSTMGFTGKGKIDLTTDFISLKGLIVPGYALNKLFGIGQVPILGRIIVGEEGGGIFAIRYDYIKTGYDKKGNFSINPASAIIPGGVRNVFDLF